MTSSGLGVHECRDRRARRLDLSGVCPNTSSKHLKIESWNMTHALLGIFSLFAV